MDRGAQRYAPPPASRSALANDSPRHERVVVGDRPALPKHAESGSGPESAPSATMRKSCRGHHGLLYCLGKGMPRISAKNQITIPVAALEEVGLHAGERVMVEPAGDGELRVRRAALSFDDAFGVLTGVYPVGYLDQLDAEDADR